MNSPQFLFDYVGDVVFVDLKNVGLVKIVLFRLLRPQLVIHVILFHVVIGFFKLRFIS